MSVRAVATQHNVARIADVWGGEHAVYHKFPEPCAPDTQTCMSLVEENKRLKQHVMHLMTVDRGSPCTGQFQLGNINPMGSRLPSEFIHPDFVKPWQRVAPVQFKSSLD